MRNLKKAGAVALAAVMAVTFAPVASFEVFAKNTGLSEEDATKGMIVEGTKILDETGTYVVSAAPDNLVIQSDVTIDLNNVDCSKNFITVQDGATLTLIDGSRTSNGKSGGKGKAEIRLGSDDADDSKDTAGSVIVDLPYGHVTTIELAGQGEGDKATKTSKASDCSFTLKAGEVDSTLAGALNNNKIKVNYISGKLADQKIDVFEYYDAEVGTNGRAHKSVIADGTPVVKAGKDYYIGNERISKYLADDANKDAVAYSGAVVATGMKSGSAIKMTKETKAGTTLSATAAADTSLVKVEETDTYAFGTKGEEDDPEEKDATTDEKTGTAKSNLTSYAAGKKGLTNLSLSAPTKETVNTAANKTMAKANKEKADSSKVLGIVSYDRAITLTQAANGKDNFENLALNYADSFDYSDKYSDDGTIRKITGANGITYFTEDPTAYTSDKNGIAVIDGNKYVIDSTTTSDQLLQASKSAKNSIKVVRGTSTTAKASGDSNEVVINSGVSLTGPEADAVFTIAKTAITGKTKTTETSGYVAGTDELPAPTANKPSIDKSVSLSKTDTDHTINVINVPQDELLTLKSFTDTTIKTADGIDYFYLMKSNAATTMGATFTFGKTKLASTAVESALNGKEYKNVTLDATAEPGDVFYASKGIKGTYKDVPDLIDVRGEISATKTAQADGKYTWVLNGGSDVQDMHRFRNELTGEHFYTSDAGEVANLQGEAGKAAGWVDETEAKNSYKVLPATSTDGVAVYRLFNSIANEHFFTTSKEEANAAVAANCGWTLEGNNGVAFKAAPADTEEATVTVYRMHRPSDDAHLFTPDEAEVTWLLGLGQGWEKEGETGVAFYGFK